MSLSPEITFEPISDADPCGEALDYDLDFLELEIASKYRPGQEIGDATIPPEPPDWREVRRLTSELGRRSKDLRLCVQGIRAALQFDGFAGFSLEISRMAALAETHWSDVHPRPDPDDESEQLTRLNALAELCDPEGLLGELRRAPLALSRGRASITLADWIDVQRPDTATADRAAIEGAFRETPTDVLDALATHIDASLEGLARVEIAVNDNIGAARGALFQPLADALKAILRLVDEHRPAPTKAQAPAEQSEAQSTTPARGTGINDRNDIVASLDEICRWYRLNEPASPVPAMLDRAKRLVAKDFMTLLLELAPAGAAQFQSLVGLSDRPQ